MGTSFSNAVGSYANCVRGLGTLVVCQLNIAANSRIHPKLGQLLTPFDEHIGSCTKGLNLGSWVEVEPHFLSRRSQPNGTSHLRILLYPRNKIHPSIIRASLALGKPSISGQMRSTTANWPSFSRASVTRNAACIWKSSPPTWRVSASTLCAPSTISI